jgi:S-adenosylmethionine decarboxylase
VLTGLNVSDAKGAVLVLVYYGLIYASTLYGSALRRNKGGEKFARSVRLTSLKSRCGAHTVGRRYLFLQLVEAPMGQHRLSSDAIDAVVEFDAISEAPAAIASGDEHLMVRQGVRCAGAHLIVDVYGGQRLDEISHVDATLRRCVEVAGATLLHVHLHHFDENGGVSGVAVLAESHISIHSWPEHDYAALDIFMCGDTQPEACVEVLREAFSAEKIAVSEFLRGKGL